MCVCVCVCVCVCKVCAPSQRHGFRRRYKEAVHHYRTAIALEPSTGHLHYNLGKVRRCAVAVSPFCRAGAHARAVCCRTLGSHYLR